jgi:hypothetical protein
MVIKTCKICGREFDAKGNAKCCSSECSKINRKNSNRESDRKWRENNPDKYSESQRKWYENNRDKVCESSRKWQQNNPDKVRERNHKYYLNNCEKECERQKKWRDDNPEYIHNYQKKLISEFCEQYSGDLEQVLENIPNAAWYIREAKMQVWFGESYADGMIAKIKSTPVCEVTGESNNLVIHHLYSFNTHPELGNDVANMVRITGTVHDDFHKIYGYGNNTPEQWCEFLQKRGD